MQLIVRPYRGVLSLSYPRVIGVHKANKNFEAIYYEHALAGDSSDEDAILGALELLEAVHALGNEGFRCRRNRAPNAIEAQKEREKGGPARGLGQEDAPELLAAAADTVPAAAGLAAAEGLDPELAATDPGPVPYRSRGRMELIALCAERDIPRSGPVEHLILRLEAWDKKNPDEPAADPTPDAPAAEAGTASEPVPPAATGAEPATGVDAPASPPGVAPADPADRPTGEVSPELGDVAGLPDAPAADGGTPASE